MELQIREQEVSVSYSIHTVVGRFVVRGLFFNRDPPLSMTDRIVNTSDQKAFSVVRIHHKSIQLNSEFIRLFFKHGCPRLWSTADSAQRVVCKFTEVFASATGITIFEY